MKIQSMGNGQSNNQRPQQSHDPNAILQECRAVGCAIDDSELRLTALQRGQRKFISSSDGAHKELESRSAELMSGYRELTNRVKCMKSRPESNNSRNNPHVAALGRRTLKAISTYQRIENQFHKDVQEQQRRQVLTMCPDATKAEIKELTSGRAGSSIFQRTLMNSNRTSQAQSTMSDIRQRHAIIQRNEEDMRELQELFQDLYTIIIQQEFMVQNGEQMAVGGHENLGAGYRGVGSRHHRLKSCTQQEIGLLRHLCRHPSAHHKDCCNLG